MKFKRLTVNFTVLSASPTRALSGVIGHVDAGGGETHASASFNEDIGSPVGIAGDEVEGMD
jgi:hypothetical protein